MIREALEFLKTELVSAAGPQFKPIDPTKDHASLSAEGTLVVFPAEPSHRNHNAYDLDTVVAFAKANHEKASIWYSRKAVVCLLDDGDRRHRATMTLAMSPQVNQLVKLEGNPLHKQRELILMLRTVFKNCLGPAGNIIDLLRKVTFSHSKEGGSEVQRGKSSIGASLRAELSGAGVLPEYVTLDVPIFEAGSLALVTSRVECVLDPEEQTESFRLQPLPGQIEAAVTAGEEKLRVLIETKLEGVDVATYYGEP